MKPAKLYQGAVFALLLSIFWIGTPCDAQDKPAFELPVELIGFPVVIVAVRLSNFVKKLAYSLNPSTYTTRSKRSIDKYAMIDVAEAEKKLVEELGEKVCIYTKVCLHHAHKAMRNGSKHKIDVDWNEVFSQYKSPAEKHKEFYLLSVFLGDIVASPKFCNQLAKIGRACSDEK